MNIANGEIQGRRLPLNDSFVDLPYQTAAIEWSNYDNADFYEQLQPEELRKLAEVAGLASAYDMELLKPYWSKTESILEIGAGYGRVINSLLHHGYSGKITAIERSNNMFDYLHSKYANHIDLIHSDLQDFASSQFSPSFDMILWLWSGINEFSASEQLLMLQSIKTLLKPNGTLAFDTLPEATIPLGVEEKKQNCTYTLRFKNGIIRGYWLSLIKIRQYGHFSYFSNFQHIEYTTSVKRKRLMNIFI